MPKKTDLKDDFDPDGKSSSDEIVNIKDALVQIGEMITTLNDKLDSSLVVINDEISEIQRNIYTINSLLLAEDTPAEHDSSSKVSDEDDDYDDDDVSDDDDECEECKVKSLKSNKSLPSIGCADLLNPSAICLKLNDFVGNIVPDIKHKEA